MPKGSAETAAPAEAVLRPAGTSYNHIFSLCLFSPFSFHTLVQMWFFFKEGDLCMFSLQVNTAPALPAFVQNR